MLLTEEQLLQKKYDALVNQVVRWNESLTRTLVELEDSPKSFRKTMIDFSFAIDEVVKDAGNRDETLCERVMADCFASQDYIEGRRAFMEKRKPKFQGR